MMKMFLWSKITLLMILAVVVLGSANANGLVQGGGAVDAITSIQGPPTIHLGETITVMTDYSTTDKDLVFTLQKAGRPWTNYWRKRISSAEDGSRITFTAPNDIPEGTPLMYQAYLVPAGKGWADHVAVKYQLGVDLGGAVDAITSIQGPPTIHLGETITVMTDYSTTDKDLVFTLQKAGRPWTNYWRKRISSAEDGSRITFTVPNDIPEGMPLMYQAYLVPAGKGWADHVAVKYQLGVDLGSDKHPWNYGRLRVSDDRRMLQNGDVPFFWMGDTAWYLGYTLSVPAWDLGGNSPLTNDDVTYYLSSRKAGEFSVIQMSALPARYLFYSDSSYAPFIGGDVSNFNPEYWEHIDFIIDKAEELGLYIALLPTWDRILPSAETAEIYGWAIAERYKDRKNIIWVIGGDAQLGENGSTSKEIWDALGSAIRSNSTHLITFHQAGGNAREWLLSADRTWLDFHMVQSGHNSNTDVTDVILKNAYQIINGGQYLVKPVLDGEPRYETIRKFTSSGFVGDRFTPKYVRQIAYRDLFNGAFGHTYGHHSVWQMWTQGRHNCCSDPVIPWKEALGSEGARQMAYVAKLMKSRPILNRIPAEEDSLLFHGDGAIATLGDGYAFVYLPNGGDVTIDLNQIASQVKAWWYDPRNGSAEYIGSFTGMEKFSTGANDDIVLVLDDQDRGFGVPGVIGDSAGEAR